MGILIATCGVVAILVYFICLIVNLVWPQMSFRNQFAIATAVLPVTIVVTLVGLLIFGNFGPSGPHDIDSGGMLLVIVFLMAGMVMLASLLVGLPVAWYSLRFMRRTK